MGGLFTGLPSIANGFVEAFPSRDFRNGNGIFAIKGIAPISEARFPLLWRII
jgi:hypothetical protein